MVRQHHRRHVWLIAAALLLAAPAAAAQPLGPVTVVGDGIPQPLTDTPGDARRGRVIAANSDRGNCLICHALPIPEAPVFGDLGPDLRGVGSRMTAPQIRLRLVNPKAINPDTTMPAYYRTEGLYRVARAYAGQPILSGQDIEDIVAYLLTVTAE
jgi:sulfur-oxidizing protein SoxX